MLAQVTFANGPLSEPGIGLGTLQVCIDNFLLNLIFDIHAVLEICSLKSGPHLTRRFMVSTMRTQKIITAYIEGLQ
jgi:hypothetical protein